jgi:putative regulator of septum formation
MMGRIPRGALIIGIGIALVALLALVIWRGAGSRDPASLVIGDCFDVPTAAQRIDDLKSRTCGGPHGGEVFHIFDAPGASATYPSDTDWEALIYPVCDPVFEAYTGTPVAERLDIGYQFLVPTADRWAGGNRRVTCFISSIDGSPLTRSFRAAP